MPRKRRWAVSAFAAAIPIVAVLLYNLTAPHLVARTDRMAERHADTGVLTGAEERFLGPETAANAIVFVHGFVGTGQDFAHLPEELAANGWRVHVMRLPGHGMRPADLKSVTAEDLLQAVRDAVTAMRKQHDFVALAGFSMGGAISTVVAAENKVDALVLAAPYYRVTHKWFYGLRPEQWVSLTAPIIPWTYKGKMFIQVNRKEARDNIVIYHWAPAEALQELQRLGVMARDNTILRAIEAPVLWIHAPGDNAASYIAAEKAFQSMNHNPKEHLRLSRSNHHVFWDHERETVSETIHTFLQNQATTPKPH